MNRQGGVDQLKQLLVEHFDRFIKSADLMADTVEAREYPIAKIGTLIDHLNRTSNLTDVILLRDLPE